MTYTQEVLQAELDQQTGKDGSRRWPWRGLLDWRNRGRIKLTDTLVIDPGVITSGGVELKSRGKGIEILCEGTIFEPDLNTDWTDKPIFSVAGTSVVFRSLRIQGNENPAAYKFGPPAAGFYGGVIEDPNAKLGHIYSGAQTLLDGCEIAGVFSSAPYVFNNWEMVTAIACDAYNGHPTGSAVLIARGGTGITSGRISDKGWTMTNWNWIGGRMSAYGPLVITRGYVGQITFQGIILQARNAPVWQAEPHPSVPTQEAIQVVWRDNRVESGLPLFARFKPGVTPRSCAIEGNWLTLQDGLPTQFVVVETPTGLRPGMVDIERNDGWAPVVPWTTKPVVNTAGV